MAAELAYAAAGLLLILLLLEGLLRGFDDFGRNGPALLNRSSGEPGVELTVGRPWYRHEFENRVRRNEEGFHAGSFEADPARPVRIGVLGDSFVEAKQIPHERNLAWRAQEELPGVQVLPLGQSALYLPRQAAFLRDELPRLFGPQGRYPALDGVVCCVRVHGMRHLASGQRLYEVGGWPRPWTYRVKQPFQQILVRILRSRYRSSSHAVSFLSSRMQDALSVDMLGTLPPVEERNIAYAEDVVREQLLGPMIELAEQQGLSVGFLYLPTIAEVEGRASQVDEQIHRHLVRLLQEQEVPFRDAGEGMPRGEPLYFPFDGHPNSAGHSAMGHELAALIREILPAP